MSENNGGNAFLWFLAGLGIGAVAGVLYAPRSGKETREAILDRAEEGRDYVITRGKHAREQVNEWVDRGREVLGKQKEQINAAVDAGRQAYREANAETSHKK
ncbi:MAG TPA: YtxH domain-containing protein [Terriglobales bacterium]|nr:YtxH domain-containing protein [Terriglobales bacterium]